MPSPFAALGIDANLLPVLARAGITEPFPIQALAIPDVLAGRDVCGKAQTGSGKTLAFGLPMVQRTTRSAPRHPHALVLVPTRELAGQVARGLEPLAVARGLRVAAIYGGVSLFRQAQVMRAGAEIVIATPGRLHDLMQRGDISVSRVAQVVIDEADQMADFGFLPQVERILDRIEQRHQTLLFSATLDGDVDRLVRKYQDHPVYHDVVSPAEEAPAIKHRFLAVTDEDKVGVAADISAGPGRTLLFVRTQRGAERLVKQLAVQGVAAGALHGGLSQPKRERALHCFASGSVPVLVATNIAARGIHVDDIETVIHHDPPEDTKTYLHRSGRTARAGASGVVVTLVGPEQIRAVNVLRREAGVRESVVAMAPGDHRLADLGGWTPPEDAAPALSNGAGSGGKRDGFSPRAGREGRQGNRRAGGSYAARPRSQPTAMRPSQVNAGGGRHS